MGRDIIFRDHPGFKDFLAVALEDAQNIEADEACTEEREERDTGTVYSLEAESFADALAAWVAFVAAAGNDAQEWADAYGWESFGSDAYLTAAGHGAGYWDRGAGALGDRLTEACRGLPTDVYFGDDDRVYLA